MIVYAYAYRKSPPGCDVRRFTDPLTPDEYPGEPASVKAQHWADENIRHYEMIQVRDALLCIAKAWISQADLGNAKAQMSKEKQRRRADSR